MSRDTFGPEFQMTMSIVAPALNNYRFFLMRVSHDLALYPVTVTDLINDTEYECPNEEVFLVALKEILSSKATHRVIDSLLSQSQAA